MARHPDWVLRKNALRGAITTWCPECKRKAALGQHIGTGRTCRYCGHFENRNGGDRRKLYAEWNNQRQRNETR